MTCADGAGGRDPWANLGSSLADVSKEAVEAIGKLGWDELLPLLDAGRNATGGDRAFDSGQVRVALDRFGDIVKTAWDRMVESLPEDHTNGDHPAGAFAAAPVRLRGEPGSVVAGVVVVTNDGTEDLVDGVPWCSDLMAPSGERVPGAEVTFRAGLVTLLPTRMDVELEVSIVLPDGLPTGRYVGHILVSGLPGWSAEIELDVEPGSPTTPAGR